MVQIDLKHPFFHSNDILQIKLNWSIYSLNVLKLPPLVIEFDVLYHWFGSSAHQICTTCNSGKHQAMLPNYKENMFVFDVSLLLLPLVIYVIYHDLMSYESDFVKWLGLDSQFNVISLFTVIHFRSFNLLQ